MKKRKECVKIEYAFNVGACYESCKHYVTEQQVEEALGTLLEAFSSWETASWKPARRSKGK